MSGPGLLRSPALGHGRALPRPPRGQGPPLAGSMPPALPAAPRRVLPGATGTRLGDARGRSSYRTSSNFLTRGPCRIPETRGIAGSRAGKWRFLDGGSGQRCFRDFRGERTLPVRERGVMVNRATFCRLLGLTLHRFEKLVAAGMPVVERPANKGGEYKLWSGEAVAWIIWQRSAVQGESLEAARARLAAERADAHAIKTAETRAALLPAAEVEETWTQAGAAARTVLVRTVDEAARSAVGAAGRQAADPAAAERAVRLDLRRRIDAALAQLAGFGG